MPRIPRRSEGSKDAPPEDQRTHLSSGDPLAPPTPASQSAAASGDPLAPASTPQGPESSGDPPTQVVPPASAAAPGEPDIAPGGSGGAQATSAGAPQEAQPTVAASPVEPSTAVHPAAGGPHATPLQSTAETGEVSAETGEQAPADARPGFRQRTRMRRRLRYLRRLRELAFRDLGGLVFDLHRFGRDRNDLVAAKLEALATIDRELRTLQDNLRDRRDFTDLREAGIAACPRCGTLHDTDANFCPGCGTTLRSAIVRDASPVTVTPTQDAEPQPQQPTPTS